MTPIDLDFNASPPMSADRNHAIERLRDRMWAELRVIFGGHVALNGHPIDDVIERLRKLVPVMDDAA